MKKRICLGVSSLLLALVVGRAYSQEAPMDMGPRAREGRPPMPMPMPGGQTQGRMGRGGREMMMQMMRDNPKLAGLMMQMRGEMMRIRGEELSKMGDVLKRYGERLEKEGVK